MKITELTLHAVEASPRGNWFFVQLHTDAGMSGIGEASQSGNDALVLSALSLMGEQLVGCDPTQPEVLWERMVRSGESFLVMLVALEQLRSVPLIRRFGISQGRRSMFRFGVCLGANAAIEYAYMRT